MQRAVATTKLAHKYRADSVNKKHTACVVNSQGNRTGGLLFMKIRQENFLYTPGATLLKIK